MRTMEIAQDHVEHHDQDQIYCVDENDDVHHEDEE